jgi:6-pyruvoyltetrahydropterin/6-carboxytetrahydropterin synthase
LSVSITKFFDFSASHVLVGLPAGHKCTRLHGHSYRVRLEIWGTLDARGFIIDYGDLDWVSNYLRDRLDHRHLNEVLSFNPTAELISDWLELEIAQWLRGRPEANRLDRISVGVSEGRNTWATTERSILN